jgi:hypothetical protein
VWKCRIENSVITGSVVSADKCRSSACKIQTDWLYVLVTKGGWTPHRYKLEHHRLATIWSAAEQRCLSDKSWVNTLQIQTGTSQISHGVVSRWTECAKFDLLTKEGPRHGFGNYVTWYMLESLFSLISQHVGGWVKNRPMDVSWHILSRVLRGNDIVTGNKTWFHYFTPESNAMG